MKVSELSGAELDLWVARAEGLDVILWDGVTQVLRRVGNDVEDYRNYSPSFDWGLAGPIIHREEIGIRPNSEGIWYATDYQERKEHAYGEGRTPLEAAMRCFVSSKFGDEVPDADQA